jgi:hypothetical protein
MVVGVAEVLPKDEPLDKWNTLSFGRDIFVSDFIRTGADGKAQTLLEHLGMLSALDENGLMYFTEAQPLCQLRGTPAQEKQSIEHLRLRKGTVRIAISRDADTEWVPAISTGNALICPHATTVLVRFVPPDTTEVIALEGTVLIRTFDPDKAPEAQPTTDWVAVPERHSAQVVGTQAPTTPLPLSREAVQRVQEQRVVAQVPPVVRPTERLPDLTPPREPARQVEARVPMNVPGDPSVSPPVVAATRSALVQIILPNPNR